MSHSLMLHATAAWLIENTGLTFPQIAEFCGLHMLEVQAIADETASTRYTPRDPVRAHELTQEEIVRGLRKACLSITAIPIVCGSAFKNKGVQPLLDSVINFLPSPLDQPPVKGFNPDKKDEELLRAPKDDEPFSALAFKIISDPHGTLSFIRVYSGRLEAGTMVYNARTGKRERVGRLVKMHASKREEIQSVETGDIAAVVGLKDTRTGDTLSDEDKPILLESIEFPDPVISVAIEPKTKADQDKLAGALYKLATEDPSFRVSSDGETGQTIIAGMGELHLEIIVDRLTREFKVAANVGKPQVAYRESILKEVDQNYKYAKQSGGRGQFAHVVFTVRPGERASGFKFENLIKGGAIPREFIPAVEKGIVEAMAGGVLAGYPVVDVQVDLTDGSYHDVDSSELAFKICASIAFKEACNKAGLQLLEPIMKVEVVTPDDFLSNVVGDINRRRGKINGMEARIGAQVVDSEVPLGEMFGYATDLRSQTQGRATFTMQFNHYAPVPAQIAEALIQK